MSHMAAVVLLAAAFASITPAHAGAANPIGKVIQLISDLEAKIIKEGETAQKEYEEYSEWCEDRSKNVQYEIKTGKAEVTDLKATIEKESSSIVSFNTQIEDLAGSITTNEADLRAATEIRKTEATDFAASEKELTEVIDTLGRAILILEKHGTSMVQLQKATTLTQALTVMVQASMLSSADSGTLTMLAQSSDDSEDADEPGSPAAANYKGHSGSIVETLEGLLEKAQNQLDDARKKETASTHNFEMMKQSLEDEIKFGNKEMTDAKKNLAASAGTKAIAEGDLGVTSKNLAEDTATLGDLHHNCMTAAEDFQAATKSRGEELNALAGAKKAIADATAGAEAVTYDAASFIQILRLSSGLDLANFEAVRFVRDLARKDGSTMLSQLASRMASAIRFGSGSGADPFQKVKALIMDMVEKLEAAGQADATHKAYCDKELGETNSKKDDKKAEVDKLSSKIEQLKSNSAQLKEQVVALQRGLAELAQSQSEMNALRQKEHATYVSNKADMEQGLEGVKMGLKILTEYYNNGDKSHEAADGAGSGIIGLVEVIESDLTQGLVEMNGAERTAQADYDSESKDNEISKATKEQDVKYKTKESTSNDNSVAELSSDLGNVQAELDAAVEYLAKLQDICVAKPDTYAERTARRTSEIAGLKQALQILEGEAALLQRGARRGLRGHLGAK